jgi:hypothetical protein
MFTLRKAECTFLFLVIARSGEAATRQSRAASTVSLFVMARLVRAIHVLLCAGAVKTWTARIKRAVT